MDNTVSLLQSFKGLRTSIHPSSLPLGYFSAAKNVRYDDGTARLRGGITLVDGQSIAQTYKGGAFFDRDGNNYYVFAMSHGASDVRIYYSVYSAGVWNAATEVTASSGQWGNTRMVEPESGFVTFTGVPGPFGTSSIIVQNGIDDPRVVALGGSPYCAINKAITAPSEAQGYKPVWGANSVLSVQAVTPTHSGTSGSFSWADAGTPQRWELELTGSISAGESTVIYNTASYVDLSDSEQIWLIFDSFTGDDVLVTSLKWEIRDSSGNYFTIHDPDNGLDSAIVELTNEPSQKILAFPVREHHPQGITQIAGFRVTNIKALTSTFTMIVGGILGSGRVPGTSSYSVSWINDLAKGESPSVNLSNPVVGTGLTGLFGSTSTHVPDGFKLPISQSLFYKVDVPVFAPSTTDRDLGVDYMNVYRRDPGDNDFYYVGAKQTSAYSGSWAYQSPFSTTVRRATFEDEVPTWGKDDTQVAPGAYAESVPIGQAGAYAGDRMYFESKADSGGKAAIFVSDYQQPFRFRSIPISSESYNAGFSAVLDGEKDITAIIPHSASTIGSGSVYVFTSKACYAVSDYLVTKVLNVGCAGVDAWSVDDNVIYFLDNELQVRGLSGGLVNLSRYEVDDKFNTITGSICSMQRFRGRLYIKTGANGAMVWSDMLRGWESEDTTALNLSQFHKWEHDGAIKFYVSLTNGDLYEYDTGNTDNGAQIALTLTGPEIHTSDWAQIKLGESYIICDDKDSETATTTYTARNPATTANGSISLDAGSGETSTWRKESSSGKDVVVRGCSVKPSITMTIEGPFRLYAWKVKTDWRAGRGATT